MKENPNIVFVFADQWRAQATGYAGDENVLTPNLDRMASESVNFVNAVSCCPVCTPARASFLTGQYPLTHGLFVNDVCLGDNAVSLARAFRSEGYETAYIGKWHVDGHGRSNYIPPERRQGFDFWKALECTHNYNESPYYSGDDSEKKIWDGYDASAQTDEACSYIKQRSLDGKPFCLVLSWGPPHNPYGTAPEKFRKLYSSEKLKLRPNVPEEYAAGARADLEGYYAHISALDNEISKLEFCLEECGIEENTIFVFWSDHGDMLGSHGLTRKQHPYDESIRVPFLLKYPALLGKDGRKLNAPVNAPDIMPTLLGLAGKNIPASVEGDDYSSYIKGDSEAPSESALVACYQPFGENRVGYEYRGLRTERYTYVETLRGPEALFDNDKDPYQMKNLIDSEKMAPEVKRLSSELHGKLSNLNDAFHEGVSLMNKWNYEIASHGGVAYTN